MLLSIFLFLVVIMIVNSAISNHSVDADKVISAQETILHKKRLKESQTLVKEELFYTKETSNTLSFSDLFLAAEVM